MRTRLTFALLVLAAIGRAQDPDVVDPDVPSGIIVPEPKWLCGEAVLQGPKAKQYTVLCCYPSLATLRQDLDHLQELQRRLLDKHVQVVAAVQGDVKAEAVAALEPGLPVANDSDGALAQLVGAGAFRVLVFDRDGSVQLGGQLGWGIQYAMENLATDRRQRNLEDLALHQALSAQLMELSAREALQAVEGMLQRNPHDGLAWGAKYVVHAIRQLDAKAARDTLGKAITALATDPAPLCMMADLVLRGDSTNKSLGRELVPALTPAAAQAPRDLGLQLTLLRALVRAGVGREVGRLSSQLAKSAGEDSCTALTLAEVLSADGTPQAYATTAQKALERAAALGAEPRMLTAVRYAVTLRCLEDKAAAQKIAADYMREHQEHVSLNNDAWYLMTQVPTMGRGDALALAMCERMLEHRENLDSFEYDTVAMSMFLNGRVPEAVELQKTALEKGGGSDPDAYRERLRRYEAALEQAGKDAGKGG